MTKTNYHLWDQPILNVLNLELMVEDYLARGPSKNDAFRFVAEEIFAIVTCSFLFEEDRARHGDFADDGYNDEYEGEECTQEQQCHDKVETALEYSFANIHQWFRVHGHHIDIPKLLDLGIAEFSQ